MLCAREGLGIDMVVRWFLGILSLTSDAVEPERKILGPVESSLNNKGVSSEMHKPSRWKGRFPFGR